MSLNIQLEDGYKQVAGNSGSAGGSILYYNTKTEFPSVGKTEKLYVDKSTGEIFTWNVGLAKYVVSGNIATAAGVSYDNTSSGLAAEVVQDAIDETVAKINDIQLFKFPNATIIGAPTINNGQVSGFSVSNYMKFPFIVNMQGRPFAIDIAFTTGTDITNQQNIIDGIDHGIAFAIRSSKFIIVLGSKTGEWDISSGEKISSVTVQPQTTYLVRISWDGSVYKFEYSTNGESYTEDATMRITSSLSLYPTQINIGVTSGLGGIFTGIINMNYCSLTISNKVVWTGMDDVGLATRMAVDMSNIDDAGVEKVKSIIGDLPTKESLELDNVTNDKQVKGLSTGTTNGHLVTWGADGYTVNDSGATIISTDINIEANKDNVPTAGAVKTAIETATIGMQKCLGTVNALTELSTTAKTGEYYRVKTAWKDEDADVHICDALIAEKDNPEQKIDGVNWSLLHNELDTDTTYQFQEGTTNGNFQFKSSSESSWTNISIYGLNDAAYMPIETSITEESDDNIIPTSKAVVDYITEEIAGLTKVEASGDGFNYPDEIAFPGDQLYVKEVDANGKPSVWSYRKSEPIIVYDTESRTDYIIGEVFVGYNFLDSTGNKAHVMYRSDENIVTIDEVEYDLSSESIMLGSENSKNYMIIKKTGSDVIVYRYIDAMFSGTSTLENLIGHIMKKDISELTYDEIAMIVRAGRAEEKFHIGDQIVTKYTDTSGTQYDMPFDVVAFREVELENNSTVPGMVIQSHYATVEEIQFDAKEPNSTDAMVAQSGWNRWMYSGIRQWLNSNANAGSWWTSTHSGDVAPSQLSSINGFMKGLPTDFINMLKKTKHETALNYVYPSGSETTYVYDITYDMFFLPSAKEEHFKYSSQPNRYDGSDREGSTWEYWIQRKGETAQDYGSENINKNSIRYSLVDRSTAKIVWLRSANRNTSYYGFYINMTGYLSNYYSSRNYSCAPACVIC